ncbi:MAG TPA: VOC family protein [Anaerolineae bacterium]|nr:VOC family protein [Anaerolineae bacterium]HQI87132.1 VOC family protein [Anaerolineae bacterium]
MHIQCQPPVIFVRDIAASRRFYEGLLGQQVAIDMGINLSFTGGFALWQVDHAHQMIFGTPVDDTGPLGRKNFEFCFETDDLDAAFARVTAANAPCIQPPHEQPWGQRVFHVYDPDGHIVEMGELMTVVIARFLAAGMSAEETARRTGMPLEMVRQISQPNDNETQK